MKKKKLAPTRKVTIRLYWQFDTSLIYLYTIMGKTGVDFDSFVKALIRSAIRGSRTRELNSYLELINGYRYDESLVLRRKIEYHLPLFEKTDSDIIGWIDGIRVGFRNSTIKEFWRSVSDIHRLTYPAFADTSLRLTGKDAKHIAGGSEQV